MKDFRLLPLTSHPGLRLAVALFLCSIAWSDAALANGKNEKNNPVAETPRPVARLITSTRAMPRPVVEASAPRVRAVMISANAAPVRRAAATVASATVAATSVERHAFDLINAQRVANGQTPFVWDGELTRMARLHSMHMAEKNFFDHVGPDGRDMVARAHDCRIFGWRSLGENISYNQGFDDPAAFAVERWMHSTKHRTNILNGGFTRSGLGAARAADGRIFFTQVFAAR
ncbi:MAG: CAP domain-containing protein [Pyrinomonadaceae bacterium]